MHRLEVWEQVLPQVLDGTQKKLSKGWRSVNSHVANKCC